MSNVGFIWSASSLQAPVHAQLARMNNAVRLTGSRMQNQVLAGQAPAPIRPVTQMRSPLERSILNMGTQSPVVQPAVKADGAGTILNQPTPKPTPGTNVTQTPVKVVQPGIDTNLATQIPGTPDEGIPKIASVSGWMAPGATLNIR